MASRAASESEEAAAEPGLDLTLNFGIEAPFALGVEEELLLIGPDRRILERGEEVAREADPDEGGVVGELFKAMVETNSDVSANAGRRSRRCAPSAVS